jgi:transposase-like protein
MTSDRVEMSGKDRQRVAAMLGKGRESARVLRRAMILRQLDQGGKIVQVARHVGVSRKTVRAVSRRYREEGLESALYEKPRPGKQRALDVKQSQRVIAMVLRVAAGRSGAVERAADCRGGGEAETGPEGGPGNDPGAAGEP